MHDEPRTSPDQAAPASRAAQTAVQRGLVLVRLTVLIPVIVLALSALGAFVYATDVAVQYARQIAEHPVPVGHKIGLFLLVVDLFLVGTTLLIAAIGLYELFLARADSENDAHLPGWLRITDLNDLKARVISMIVLVAAVRFVEVIVDNNGGQPVLDLGVAIGVVILSLTVFMRLSETRRDDR